MNKHTGHARVAAILCERDECTFEEAEQRIAETLELMEQENFDPTTCEDIMAEELGLEMDYIFDLLMY